MKIFRLPERNVCPYLEDIKHYKRAKDWIFAAMKKLGCGYRDIAGISGFRGDAEIEAFYSKLTKGHRLQTKSEKFTSIRARIEIELIIKYKEDLKLAQSMRPQNIGDESAKAQNYSNN